MISGKTLLLKERCIRTKRRNPGNKILMISLASTDVYGNPYDVPCIYDVLSEKEMAHHKIDFMNANQLFLEHIEILKNSKKSSGHKSFVEGDNLKFVYDLILRRTKGEITSSQEAKICYNHGIDDNNAVEYFNAQRLKGSPDENTYDIYEMLLEYIKRNPHCDYYIDELPILINRKCKH